MLRIKRTLLFCALAIGVGLSAFADKTVAELLKDSGYSYTVTNGYSGAVRYKFKFEGYKAYFDEPSNAKEGRKWIWCMKWPGAFAAYTGQIDGVKRGYYYVYLDDIRWMNPEGVKIAKKFKDFLVNKLKFANKANLIGMSWGGFYSTRYAANYPEDIEKIYIDNPVMNFDAFELDKWPPAAQAWGKSESGSWVDDSRMPINLAEKIAKAKIPVLLLYGSLDTTVIPKDNCEIFIQRFKAAGGDIKVYERKNYGHHPHGFTNKATYGAVVDFFEGKDFKSKVEKCD